MCHTDPLSPMFMGLVNGNKQFGRQQHLQYARKICILEWKAVSKEKHLQYLLAVSASGGPWNGMGGHFHTKTSTIRVGSKYCKGF